MRGLPPNNPLGLSTRNKSRGAPYLARFSRDVGYHKSQSEVLRHSTVEGNRRVPLVRQSVRGPKTMGAAQRSLSLDQGSLLQSQLTVQPVRLLSTAISSTRIVLQA